MLLEKGTAVAQTIAFYLERAEEAAEEARNATLENVRERAQRSEASWRAMATRMQTIEENRTRRARETADRAENSPQNTNMNGGW